MHWPYRLAILLPVQGRAYMSLVVVVLTLGVSVMSAEKQHRAIQLRVLPFIVRRTAPGHGQHG